MLPGMVASASKQRGIGDGLRASALPVFQGTARMSGCRGTGLLGGLLQGDKLPANALLSERKFGVSRELRASDASGLRWDAG
jgi:hypothetical protein